MATRRLTKYREKRDFSKTPEPKGARSVADAQQLRFVIQKHAARRLHYDLRLEFNGVFKSWAVTRRPSVDPADKRLAVEVEDHPLEYGDFEGSIPKGEYGGGTVQLWDRGYWHPEGTLPVGEALTKGNLKFTLDGSRLKGGWVLVRMRNDWRGGKRTNWLLIKHKDAYSRTGESDASRPNERSVASGRTLQQIAAGTGKAPEPFIVADVESDSVNANSNAKQRRHPSQQLKSAAARPADSSTRKGRPAAAKAMPQFIEPQLCKLVDRPPAEAGWVHEIKFDGYRAQLRVERGTATIRTRRGLDWTKQFADIAADATHLPDCLIDGEIVALDQHDMPSFAALQAALSAGASGHLIFFGFDLLFDNGKDLRPLALRDRKSRLEVLLGHADIGKRLSYVQHFESRADTVLLSACKMHLEGIVSKRLDAPYASGRSGNWTKAKCRASQEVVLGGWATVGGKFRSLLAGVHRHGQLRYVGRVGTGYGGKVTALLVPQLKRLTRAKSPFHGENAPKEAADIHWLKPSLVAEIDFAGWTESGMIRQGSYKGLRKDKPATEVVEEIPVAPEAVEMDSRNKSSARPGPKSRPGRSRSNRRAARAPITNSAESSVRGPSRAVVMGVSLSKPDKSLWPDAGDRRPVTKLDLAHYYESVGHWMLPHLVGRPVSLLRLPDGLGGQQFFQRHAMAGLSNLFETVKVRGERAPYLQIDRIEALIVCAQMGAVEVHPWNCVPNDPQLAGRLVFDLDPGPKVEFAAVVAAALEIRDRLVAVGLESFCKTTGGKGLHVVAPLISGRQAVNWSMAKNFAQIICAQMVQDSPARYVANMSKAQRIGKIFLDYLRNDRTATAVAVLSPRARAGATVSMPLRWKDVDKTVDPTRFTVRTAPAALPKTNPWQGYDKAAGSLLAAAKKLAKPGNTGRSG